MLKEELNGTAGWIALLAILGILVILLAVLGLVVVNALAASPWGIFTVGATIPIALFMGGYLRCWRTGKVLEATILGVLLLLAAVWGGQYVSGHPNLSQLLTFKKEPLAWTIVLYGFAASVMPIWLLLAPRDYLSAFLKLGTILLLALGVFLVLPKLQMPALTPFVHSGNGPVLAGKLFPFCFITIACGAISGFHALISSGTTPRLLLRESDARSIGYGAMCLESLVAIMALIAACALPPGVYFSINTTGAAADTMAKVSALGWPVAPDQMSQLAASIGEHTLFGRVGGAPTLAVGMAQIFSSVFHGAGLALWYHFAIMFEALFILTTLDAGTRVGRYLLQDVLGAIWKPLGQTGGARASWLASFLMVGAWGWFLVGGVRDPLGGVNSLWPLFGIANQLLASIALCLAATVILKIQLTHPGGKPARAAIAFLPLLWLLAVTMTAGVEKIFSADPRLGFLAAARHLQGRLRGNAILDAVVTGLFLLASFLIFALSFREWILLLARRKLAALRESTPVWLPESALLEPRPLRFFGALGLALLLVKELSGQSAVDRAQNCQTHNNPKGRRHAYLCVVEKRFTGVNRCC
jgi:carbon starvation protein